MSDKSNVEHLAQSCRDLRITKCLPGTAYRHYKSGDIYIIDNVGIYEPFLGATVEYHSVEHPDLPWFRPVHVFFEQIRIVGDDARTTWVPRYARCPEHDEPVITRQRVASLLKAIEIARPILLELAETSELQSDVRCWHDFLAALCEYDVPPKSQDTETGPAP